MLQKLPDWLTSRWNRHVTKQMRKTEEYPNFKEFSVFVAEEAEIACNPVTSFQALKTTEEKPIRDVKCPKANVFITGLNAADTTTTVMTTYSAVNGSKDSTAPKKVNSSFPSSNPVPCMFCGESHSIHKCQKLSSKPTEEKRRFILDNNLCFGCLRRGHNAKDCRNKSTRGMCKNPHPTPLHKDRSGVADTSSSHALQAEANTSSLSCCVGRGDDGSISMIVPVWISSTTNPVKETLVYTLLDTQSSNTFVDQDVCGKLGVGSEPVKLIRASLPL